MIKKIIFILFTAGLLFSISCSHKATHKNFHVNWVPIDSLNQKLPKGIHIYFGENTNIPVRAWLVEVVPKDSVQIDVVLSPDSDKKETPQDIARWSKADVVLNAGYFIMDKNPAEHVGLILTDGQYKEHCLTSMLKNNTRYYTTRGALGYNQNGVMDIAWVSEKDDIVYQWKKPIKNSKSHPASMPDYSNATPWPVWDAVQAGPVLVEDGKIDIPINDEVFFDSSIPDAHPRTAAGYTADGIQYYMVVDGRQPGSRGVFLDELARLFRDLHCVEAINLDGGGSSAMIVAGHLLNRPAGNTIQREVMTAITIHGRHD